MADDFERIIGPLTEEQRKALRAQVFRIFETLTSREERALRRRFGVRRICVANNEETPQRIREIEARALEKLRQIEARALEKLRDPTQSRILSSFLE